MPVEAPIEHNWCVVIKIEASAKIFFSTVSRASSDLQSLTQSRQANFSTNSVRKFH